GESKPREPIDSNVELFDLKSNKWLQPLSISSDIKPDPRVGHTAVTIPIRNTSEIYLLGGRGGAEMTPFPSTLYKLTCDPDLKSGKWEVFPVTESSPSPRSYHASTASKTHIYIFGGCPEKGRLNDLHRFNIVTKTWESFTAPDELVPRGGPGLTYLNGMLILFGGFNGSELDDIWIWKESECVWRKVTVDEKGGKPEPRSVCGFVGLEKLGKAVLFHGEKDPSASGHAGAGRYASDVWLLEVRDDATATWTQCLPGPVANGDIEPSARGWISASAYEGDKLVMMGGYDGVTRDNSVSVLSFQ
ncbi:hypothetical protein HDU76_009291, partial [Blyttiomyces sp. JEL0837]